MSERPYVSFAEVKQKVSMPDVIQALELAGRFTRKGDTFAGVCPFPSHQHGPSPNAEQFKINFRNGVWLWHCFGDCQRGGDVVEFVKAMMGYDNAHVRFWFAEKFGDRLVAKNGNGRQKSKQTSDANTPETSATESTTAVKAVEALPHPREPECPAERPTEETKELKPLRFHLRLDPEVAYLKDRGLTSETIQRYGLGLCSRGVLKGYVAIPVYTDQSADENPVAYLGRWPGEDYDEAAGNPRYRWPEGFPKSRVVYGLREAIVDPKPRPLIVVEGPFKVYHMVQAGFGSTVSVMGASLSDEQAAILVETGRPIVLFFDGNEAGQAGMRLAAAKIIRRAFVRVVPLPAGKEPDDLSAEELGRILPFVA